MNKPGRESTASLEVPSIVGLPQRPEPPASLTEAEAKEWRDIVATKPAEWFMRDTQPVLVVYCQAIVRHGDLVAWYRQQRDDAESPKKELRETVALVNATGALIASIATKLRLTQQSRYTPDSARTAASKPDGRALWQKQG